MLTRVAQDREVALLSGDNEREQATFAELFGPAATLRFRQGPADKLAFVRSRQEQGRTVLMAGDGLNDAGALRQARRGIARRPRRSTTLLTPKPIRMPAISWRRWRSRAATMAVFSICASTLPGWRG